MLWLSLGVVVDPGMLLLKAVEDPVKLLPMRGSLTVGPSWGPPSNPRRGTRGWGGVVDEEPAPERGNAA